MSTQRLRSRWGLVLYEIMVELRQETAWGGVTSLMVTSGGTHWIWWESWLLPGHDPSETPGAAQAVHRRLKKEQGRTGGRVIVGRKTVTYIQVN